MTPKKVYRRGYPVAMLLGFEEDNVTLWSIFSKVVKPLSTLHIEGSPTDSRARYNLYERTVDALRPCFTGGLRSVILVSPLRTVYSKSFKDHVGKHHSWLIQGTSRTAFAELAGAACTLAQVTSLTRSPAFQKIVNEATTEESMHLLELLEKRLSTSGPRETVLYSVTETENVIFHSKGSSEIEYLLLTDRYLVEYRGKGRVERLLQVAANKKVKTRIVKVDSPAGKRLTQLGGFVCLIKPT